MIQTQPMQNWSNLSLIKEYQIGTHSYSHADIGSPQISTQAIWTEMRLNDEAIKRIIQKRPTHLRPPFLSTSANMLTAVGSWGYRVVSINLDTKDFLHTNAKTQVAENHKSIDQKLNGSNAKTQSFISLNHDKTSNIFQWVDEFVKQAQGKGYALVTTAECIGDRKPYREWLVE
jgi:peptidoglycan/xylan/chitin deacetylase (PgdA/CDA1 family)